MTEPVKEFVPFVEEDYRLRVPHKSYCLQKELEDKVMGLQRENLKVIVICSGILYGKGEIVLHNLLQVYKNWVFFLKGAPFVK